MRIKFEKFGAFTLAEVLVTLGIIGVVSAMTVPTLMQNYQRQSYVTQLHKVYNEVTQVFLRIKDDNNALTLSEAGFNSQATVNSYLRTYFKTVNTCSKLEPPCVPNTEYRNLNGGSVASGAIENVKTWWGNVDCGVLASGATICIESFASHGASNGVKWSHIFVDTNGMKGPNIAGRDAFFLAYFEDGTIDEEGVVPACDTMKQCSLPANAVATRESNYSSRCSTSSRFLGCFGKILNDNWQMTY